MQITIQVPDELEQKLTERATQRNIPLETLILDSLAELVESLDPDDTPKAVVLQGLRASFEDVKAGRVYPIAELWDGLTLVSR
jgi:predicted transcriptional regulator